ncbi:MAG: hypothetical protein QOF64_2442, partial [Candidatus Binatota bacterium]|nr:hypothetical protein [Candidatus Binatota bacterium]
FNSAVDSWFTAQTDGVIADYLLDPSPHYGDFIDRTRVESLVRDHASGADRSHGYALLSILMLEIWLSSFLPRATASATTPVAVGEAAG